MFEEGGYYAIKGFSFQYIISLIEVLSCTDKNKKFYFEKLQDFNDNEVIYQMKYKETQHFTNSKLKEPTIKLFSEYLETKKDYILYVCFNDKTNDEIIFNSIDELNNIILNCKVEKKQYSFTDKQKKDFIKHFKIIFSKDYIEKSNELVELISTIMSVSKDIAEAYCYSLVTYIINIIIKNNPQNRICTKNELIEYLKKTATKIFYEYSIKYYGKEKYLKTIKSQYFFERNINDRNRLIIINTQFTSLNDCYDCICKIVSKFYVVNKKNSMILSRAPYIYFSNLDLNNFIELKKMIFNNFRFTDGYLYKDAEFDLKYITKKMYVSDNIKCKIINDEENLISVIEKLKQEKIKIYQFYDAKSGSYNIPYECIAIEIDEITDILKILR